jgi:hypothetical protein
MKSSDHHLSHRSQWQLYQQMESIPESVNDPASQANPLASALNVFWRPLLGLLIDELVEEQRVEYLERCWTLSEFNEAAPTDSLQRFWVLIN